MTKLTDFQCPNCGAVEEHFDDEKYVWCTSESCDNKDVLMQPIFTPKNNSQRARVNDKDVRK